MSMRRTRPQASMLLTHRAPSAPAAEAFRTLCTNLQALTRDLPSRTLVVTSALAQEGKTVTAVNLAVACAQTGARVCLVDADLRNPSLAGMLDGKEWPGLTTAMAGGAPAISFVQETEVAGVHLLATGKKPANFPGLVGHPRIPEIFSTLRGNYDWVIFDAPEVLGINDALVLAPNADGVLLVTRAGATPSALVGRARDALQGVGARVLGLVLTGAEGSRALLG